MPLSNEPVYLGGQIIGKTTSAAFGYRIGKPVAIAQINTSPGQSLGELPVEVDIACSNFSGNISLTCAYDPEGLGMRTKIESHA
jgi:4-methylaminobutanoate oxidase (formaldehyde-forming)